MRMSTPRFPARMAPRVAVALVGLSALASAQAAPDAGEPAALESVALADPVPVRWSSSAEVIGTTYRWSMYRGPLDVGLGFDLGERAGRRLEPVLESPVPVTSMLPSIHFGLRSIERRDPAPASSLLERSLGVQAVAPPATRIGIEWKPAEPQVSFLRQGLGIRLDGDQRLVMRLRKGWIGVYLKSEF